MHEVFESWIPDFTYFLVNNHDFSNEELLNHSDEMSLIMLLNKIQNVADFSEFQALPTKDINKIVRESPEAVIDIIVMVVQALCMKLNITKEDTDKCMEKVRTRNMGYLWENMEKIDIQEERRLALEAKEELKKVIEQTKIEISRVKEESEAEISRVKEESEAEISRVKEESEAELSRVKEESEAEISRVKNESEAELSEARTVQKDLQEENEHLKSLLKSYGIIL